MAATREYKSTWWSVSIPADWTARLEPECTTFISNAFPAVLQISAFNKGSGVVTPEDILEFAASDGNRARLRQILSGEAVGLYDEHCEEEFFWREWWLGKQSLLVYITYSIPERLKDRETALIDEIVASLKSSISRASPGG